MMVLMPIAKNEAHENERARTQMLQYCSCVKMQDSGRKQQGEEASKQGLILPCEGWARGKDATGMSSKHELSFSEGESCGPGARSPPPGSAGCPSPSISSAPPPNCPTPHPAWPPPLPTNTWIPPNSSSLAIFPLVLAVAGCCCLRAGNPGDKL
jgi:hypothetical protein